MKTFNLKSKLIIATTVLGLTFGATSANANEQATSYEEVVAAYISAQGEQIMADLAVNIENNIATQLQDFKQKYASTLTTELAVEKAADTSKGTKTKDDIAEE